MRTISLRASPVQSHPDTLQAIQGQIDGFFSQLPSTCHLEVVASVGDRLKICPELDFRVGGVRTISLRASPMQSHPDGIRLYGHPCAQAHQVMSL